MSHFQNAKGLDASDSSGAAARSALRFALHAPGAAFERVAASCAARSSGAARGLFHELLGALTDAGHQLCRASIFRTADTRCWLTKALE